MSLQNQGRFVKTEVCWSFAKGISSLCESFTPKHMQQQQKDAGLLPCFYLRLPMKYGLGSYQISFEPQHKEIRSQ